MIGTRPHVDAGRPHLLFSISKSITALLAGILQDHGRLDPVQTVSHYWPETASCGFGDCPVQHVLDMRVSLDFTEDYLDTTGVYARYRRATAWNPTLKENAVKVSRPSCCRSARGAAPHGGPFHYLSPCSDMLGLLLEKVTGEPFADLMSRLLWQPMGAQTDALLSLDEKGAPRGAGGICATPHDLLRLGELLLHNGEIDGDRVVSDRWIQTPGATVIMRHGGPEISTP